SECGKEITEKVLLLRIVLISAKNASLKCTSFVYLRFCESLLNRPHLNAFSMSSIMRLDREFILVVQLHRHQMRDKPELQNTLAYFCLLDHCVCAFNGIFYTEKSP
uniref:Uncharacterized protein n=1 Tax=Parascaris univalens TaxID=6257 RepID=A0A915C2D9_PARUN